MKVEPRYILIIKNKNISSKAKEFLATMVGMMISRSFPPHLER